MEKRLLHVFRNTPLGRETLLQSIYFCRSLGAALHIYIPQATQFLMYFDHDAVQVDLDGSYLTDPETALAHATELAEENGVRSSFLQPKNFTASQLPDIPTNFSYMCCPRSISDLSSKIGLGYIGPKVRRIVKSSSFPVLLTSAVYKAWNNIAVFYGGSLNANKALRWGLDISEKSGFPVDMFTLREGHDDNYFTEQLNQAGLLEKARKQVRRWHKFDKAPLESHLYAIPHDALIIVGAYGHNLIKEFLFGSKMEVIQSWMPNNILLIGPSSTFGA